MKLWKLRATSPLFSGYWLECRTVKLIYQLDLNSLFWCFHVRRHKLGHLSSLPHPLSSMADYCPQPARHRLDQLKGTSALRYTDRLPQPSPLTMPHLIDDLNKPVLPSMRTLISSPLSWSPLLWILFGPHHKGIMSNDKGLERTRNIFFFYSFTVFMTMPMGTLTALGKRG